MSDIEFPVEAGQIMLFARAVGDDHPDYYGPDAPAPPTFVQSSAQYDPDYPLRPKTGEPWFGSGKTPSGRSGSGSGGGNAGTLHAEQHYTYHLPLKAGMRLTATQKPGNSWEKTGKRAGRLLFSEMITEYRDDRGRLVVTARSVGVRTEKVIDNTGE